MPFTTANILFHRRYAPVSVYQKTPVNKPEVRSRRAAIATTQLAFWEHSSLPTRQRRTADRHLKLSCIDDSEAIEDFTELQSVFKADLLK